MRRTLQILGLILAVAGLGFWLARGANCGWTKTSVPVKFVDEVTGIEGIQYRKRIVPGVDFLALVLTGAAIFEASSLLLKRRPKTQSVPD